MGLSGKERFAREFKNRREHAGLSQSGLARLSGLTQANISLIENGKYNLENISVGTIIRLASALSEEVTEMVWLVQSCIAEYNPAYSAPSAKRKSQNTSDPPVNSNTVQHVQLQYGVPRRNLIWDSLNEQAIKEKLLQSYYPAFHALEHQNDQIEFLLRFLIPTYTNIGAIDISVSLITITEQLYQQWQAVHQETHPLFETMIAEWRGWNAQYQGKFSVSRMFFEQMVSSALILGDTFRQATAHHFIGRATYTPQAYRFWFSKLFSSVKRQDLSLSIHHLTASDQLHQCNHSDTAVIFNNLRFGAALATQGQLNRGQQQIQQCLQDFEQVGLVSGGLRAQLEFIKIKLYDTSVNRNEIADNLEQLQAILLQLRNLQHPLTLAETCILLAYAHFLLGNILRYQTVREDVADLTHLALLVYPYSSHPVFNIASHLHHISLSQMSDNQRSHYLHQLDNRLQDENDSWYAWLNRFAHTGNTNLTHVSKVEYLAYKLALSPEPNQ